MVESIEVQTVTELIQVKDLFRATFQFLAKEHGLDISYQGIEDELASLLHQMAD